MTLRKDTRYVQGACSMCGVLSPVCDQQTDPRRSEVAMWFERHKREAHPMWLEWEVAAMPHPGRNGAPDGLA